jgi:AcrR family transcriptional regulator
MNNTRDHIIHTAFGLFLQKSYKEVTMKNIVDSTGLSKGAFYHYFESKEQLFLEIAELFIFSLFNEGYRDLPEHSLRDFYRACIKNISAMMNQIQHDERFPAIDRENGQIGLNYYTLIFDAIKHVPGFSIQINEMQLKELAIWQKAVENARTRGEIRTAMTDEQIARIFIYTNDGVSIRVLMENAFYELEPTLLKLWDAFYEELKA